MPGNHFLDKKEDGILTITIHRPEKQNTLTMGALMDLAQIFRRVNEQDDVRCIILTGSGDYFSAGADLSAGVEGFDLARISSLKDKAFDQSEVNQLSPGSQLALSIFSCLKPTIAAINGPAAGVGATVILPMDYRLMSETAKIGYVFSKRGFCLEAGSSWFLPRVVGTTKAMDWGLSGRLIEPQEALASGLVNGVYKPEELLPAAYAIARDLIAKTSPVSVACNRQLLWRMSGPAELEQATALETLCFVDRLQQADAKEGIMAFMEKRLPSFKDKVSQHMPGLFSWLGKS